MKLYQLLHTIGKKPVSVSDDGKMSVRSADLEALLSTIVGAVNASAKTDPAAASACLLELIRGLLSRNDVALSALRDAITKTGSTSKTLADVVAALANVPVTVNGSLVSKLTNIAVTLNTNILVQNYTATGNKTSLLMISTGTSGVISLIVDGISAQLNAGTALQVGKWYAFEIPMTDQSTYNLQSSVSATMQIKWIMR